MDKQKNYKLILHILITAVCLVVFLYIALRTKPFPISDFQYYWDSATHLSMYYKGGLLFFPYAPLKLLGLEPYIAAFIVNSLSFIAIAYCMWIGGKSKWQWLSTILLVFVGIWLLGFIPIVNTDIPTVAFFILGIRLFIDFLNSKNKLFLILAILCLAFSLTLRAQLFYISIITIVLILPFHFFRKKLALKQGFAFLLIFLISSVCLSFLGTKVIEARSQEHEQIVFIKRLTFYTGLLDTTSDSLSCGNWTPHAEYRTRNELEAPLSTVLFEGLKNFTPQQIVDIIQCKWKNYIFEYNGSAMTWLEMHIIYENNGYVFGSYWNNLKYAEYYSAQILKLVPFLLLLLFVYEIKKYSKVEIIGFIFTIFVVLCFFAIHTILEIQPRYIISPVLISLVFSLYLHSRMLKDV